MFLRHFNELDHELMMRLNRAYEHAVKYMDLFVSPVGTILARYKHCVVQSAMCDVGSLSLSPGTLLSWLAQ